METVYLYYIPRGNAIISANENDYVVNFRNDIPMIIARKDDVDILLSKRCDCNCGTGMKKLCLRLATLEEIQKWHE